MENSDSIVEYEEKSIDFEVTSGKVHITDPCYDVGTWCGAYNLTAKKGRWKVRGWKKLIKLDNPNYESEMKKWELLERYIDPKPSRDLSHYRQAALDVYHEDSVIDWDNWNNFERLDDIGVDSGQCGVFDSEKFEPQDSNYYDICCEATRDGCGGFGSVDGGAVSSSGWGDGSYKAFTQTDKGELVAVRIVFMDPDESEKWECHDG
ncbi:MAG: hypothetical protein ACTSRU_16610 [Candidatus Hodarchaeales archaeon]